MAKVVNKGRRVLVEILTDNYQIRGTLIIPLVGKGGYRTRVSDLLNNTEVQFLSVTDVHAVALPDPNEKWEAPFMAVNKNAVIAVREIKE
jgi:hypothetical protein